MTLYQNVKLQFNSKIQKYIFLFQICKIYIYIYIISAYRFNINNNMRSFIFSKKYFYLLK